MKVICKAHKECELSFKNRKIDYCPHSIPHEDIERVDDMRDMISCSAGCDVPHGIPGANCIPV